MQLTDVLTISDNNDFDCYFIINWFNSQLVAQMLKQQLLYKDYNKHSMSLDKKIVYRLIE